MANNSTMGTGVLRLSVPTAVISALFKGYSLDAAYPGGGAVYICSDSEAGGSTWEDVEESLQELAETLGLVPAGGEPLHLKELVAKLSAHYGKDASGVQHLLEPGMDENASLSELFDLAQVLDDGHGLWALEMETAHYCSKPRLYEFGGYGLFLGKDVVVTSGSHTALQVGPKLDAAVNARDVDATVAVLSQQLAETLLWINEPDLRLEVAKRLGLPG